MSNPIKLDWKTAQQIYLPSGVSSLIKNIGRTSVYISTSDGVTSLSYDFVLLPGSSVEWNGDTRLFAITNDGDYGYIAIVADSHFIFEGSQPTYWDPPVYPWATYTLPANVVQNFPTADTNKRYFEVGNAVELQINVAFKNNTTPGDNNPFVSVILKWYNTPDLSDTPVNEEYLCTINSPTTKYNGNVLLGTEPEMYYIKSAPKGKYLTVQMLNWLTASTVLAEFTMQWLNVRTTSRERLFGSPDQGYAASLPDSNGISNFSNPNDGIIQFFGNYAASASRAYLVPPMPGRALLNAYTGAGAVFIGLYSMNYGNQNTLINVETVNAGSLLSTQLVLPNLPLMLLLINNSGAGVVANGLNISIISDVTKA